MRDDGRLLALGAIAALVGVAAVAQRRGSRDWYKVTVQRKEPGPDWMVGRRQYVVESDWEDVAEQQAVARAMEEPYEVWELSPGWDPFGEPDPQRITHQAVDVVPAPRRSIRGFR